MPSNLAHKADPLRLAKRLLVWLVVADILAPILPIAGIVGALWIGGQARWLPAADLIVVFLLVACCKYDRLSPILERARAVLSSDRPSLARYRKALFTLTIVGFVLAFGSGWVLLASARYDGDIESYPVFAKRDVYRLISGSDATSVSRLRYLLVGVSSQLAMGFFCLTLNVALLHYLLFGDFRWNRDTTKQASSERN